MSVQLGNGTFKVINCTITDPSFGQLCLVFINDEEPEPESGSFGPFVRFIIDPRSRMTTFFEQVPFHNVDYRASLRGEYGTVQ